MTTTTPAPGGPAAATGDLTALVDELVARHGGDRGALIPVLAELRALRLGIDEDAVHAVAERLGLSAVEVEGVATFYSFLGLGRSGRHVVRVCRTLSCRMAGSALVASRLAADLGIELGGTTPDGEVTVEWANCIGMCDHAPAMLVGTSAHGDLTPDSAVRQVRAAAAGSAAPPA